MLKLGKKISISKVFSMSISTTKITKSKLQSKTIDLEYLRNRLSKFNAPDYFDKYLKNQSKFIKQASVLIPISIRQDPGDENPRTYFTLSKRTDLLTSHKGEVCFLGGKKDNNETEVETAYREAREEANLDPSSLTFLAQLCPIISYQQILVTPVIAYFDQTNFTPIINKDEVELLFDLPTDRFLSNVRHKTKTVTNSGGSYHIHYFKDIIDGKSVTTWGMTAFLAIVVSSLLHSRQPDFELILGKNLDINNVNKYLEQYLFSKLSVSQADRKRLQNDDPKSKL